MSFIIPRDTGNFLNAKTVIREGLTGKIAVIKSEGEIRDFTSNEGKTKVMWNIPVEVENLSLIYTPNATNMKIMAEAWGTEKEIDGKKQKGIEMRDVVGKSFKINLVKVNFKGQVVDSIQIEPLKDALVVEGKKVENVKI